ncbi:MAG: hypothetical protein FWE53_00065 [Firmicutes bacterium]|nr:hypothetical protein [Bacillota bacterium]
MKITKFTPLDMEDRLDTLNTTSPVPTKSTKEMLDALFKQEIEGKLFFEVLNNPVKIAYDGTLAKPIIVGKPSTRDIYASAIAKGNKHPREFWAGGDFDLWDGHFRVYDEMMNRRNRAEYAVEYAEPGEKPLKKDEAWVTLVFDRTIEKGKPNNRLLGALAWKGPWTMLTAEPAKEAAPKLSK